MSSDVGEPVGSVGGVGQLGDEWAFTLYDGQGREIVAFVFHSERDARQGAEAMHDMLGAGRRRLAGRRAPLQLRARGERLTLRRERPSSIATV
jgi:hypothetical protein